MTQSMDMLGDFIKAYEYLKAYYQQNNIKTDISVAHWYYKSVNFKAKLNEIKQNTYFVSDFIKKSLRKLGLLNHLSVLESTFIKNRC
jgi:hypothetical protein